LCSWTAVAAASWTSPAAIVSPSTGEYNSPTESAAYCPTSRGETIAAGEVQDAAATAVQEHNAQDTEDVDIVAAIPVEYDTERKIRERNKLYYRFNHWPIWIFVYFIAPGPVTFNLFAQGFDRSMALWLGAVLIGTGVAGLRGALPGVEPRPYIIRFTEDRPNPLYRRVCYTLAWSEAVAFAVMNIAGLMVAIVTGHWYLKQIYWYAYFPLAGSIWILGALGQLPRVRASTKGEGHERRYFYGSVWAVCWAQPALWLMLYVVPKGRVGDTVKLVVFVAILAFVGNLARLGKLPRTRPIVPGELAVSD
jgi:hypothetical protein